MNELFRKIKEIFDTRVNRPIEHMKAMAILEKTVATYREELKKYGVEETADTMQLANSSLSREELGKLLNASRCDMTAIFTILGFITQVILEGDKFLKEAHNDKDISRIFRNIHEEPFNY